MQTMKSRQFRLLMFVLLLAALVGIPHPASAVTTVTVLANGNFGTSNAQATIAGAHSMTLATNGAISYPAGANGPALGTAGQVRINTNRLLNDVFISCEAVKTITDAAGCCGTTNRNMTQFRFVTGTASVGGIGVGNICRGLGVGEVRFRPNGIPAHDTIVIGATMDATHVKIGGTYTLAAGPGGRLNVRVRSTIDPQVNALVDFRAIFRSLVGFSSVTNLNFGKIAFTAQPTAADRVDLGTNGTAVYAGVFSPQGGVLAAGQVTMNNVQNGVTVEVRCDTATTMTNGAGKRIQVTGLKVARKGGTGAYAAAGSACAGSGAAAPATTMVYNAGTRDQFFFGGRLNGGTASAGFVNGTYATANAGGVYAVVTVINQ